MGTENMPQVRETLGRVAAEAGIVEGMVHAMEVKGRNWGRYFIPDAHLLYSAQVFTQQLYPKMIGSIRELAGGNLIMLPSGVEDLADSRIADYILRAQGSAALSPLERVKLFKLAWDAIGSEFGSRHTQYEMFYSGAGFVTRGHSFRTYDWDQATGLVDRLLHSYDWED